MQHCFGRRCRIAYFCQNFFAVIRSRITIRENIVCGRNLTSKEIFIVTKHDLVLRAADIRHEGRLCEGDAETFALTDRIMQDAAVRAEHIAVPIHKIAGRGSIACSCDIVNIVIGLVNKADLLTVLFVRIAQVTFSGELPRILFGKKLSEWENQAAEYLLTQTIQYIGLVFFVVGRAADIIGMICFIMQDPAVMPGRDIIGPDLVGMMNQALKLDIRIAQDTRIRCPSMQVFRYEVLYDDAAKI